MKSITEYFNYLYSLERSGMKYDLSNITYLLKKLGNPHEGLRFIHIAGTNGKGATASLIASILKEAGYKTGLFTSPHILKFNERIRIDGKMIPDSYIKQFLNDNIKLIRKVKPSFFEVNTALAFKYFHEKKVDAAVIEAGLGGRLDSTNTINPEVSVITQIGMDHMQYLGSTLRKIAIEKLGIVKPHTFTIVSDNNSTLENLIKKKIRSDYLYYLDDRCRIGHIKNEKGGFTFDLGLDDDKPIKLFTPLSGNFQTRNIASAIAAVMKFTNGEIGKYDIDRGLNLVGKNTGYFGRLQSIKYNSRKYIFDISHNPDGIANSVKHLKNTKIDTVVFAMMADKDYKSSLSLIAGLGKNLIFTKPKYKRALEPETMLNYSDNYTGKRTKRYIKDNVKDALKLAIEITKAGDTILVIGSFFLVSEAVKALKLEKHFT